jgi:hypothetical protein
MRRLFVFWLASAPIAAQVCTHVVDQRVDTAYYEANHYVVAHIVLRQTFDFLPVVHAALDRLKKSLPMKEGAPYTRALDDHSFEALKSSLDDDPATGTLPFKVTAGLSHIKNCNESAQPGTLEVHYSLFSTDPFAAAAVPPESKNGETQDPAMAAGNTTHPASKVIPDVTYDRTDRLGGGGTVQGNLSVPGLESLMVSGSGSSSSRRVLSQVSGNRVVGLAALDLLNYHLQYSSLDQPAGKLQLKENLLSLRGIATAKTQTFASGNTLGYRYGVSIAGGNQQSGGVATTPSGTLANSREGDIRLLGGVTYQTRYNQLVGSYALRISGPGLDALSNAAHIGDLTYSWRQGGTHAPFDIVARGSAGIITGSKDILLNGRFFGGNAVEAFLPGDSWTIPTGPLVRSIARNRLNGLGYGGTSFYSTNLTVGKVLKSSPLVPTEIEKSAGFADGVTAAENTAETFFVDDYESSADQYKAMVNKFGARFITDLTAVQDFLHTAALSGSTARDAGSQARGSLSVARMATQDTPLVLKTFLNESQSKVLKLVADLEKLAPTLSADQKAKVDDSIDTLNRDLKDFGDALKAMDQSTTADAARARAKKDMVRPREVIDTLRHEADVWSVSAVGIFDIGRVWPDPMGLHYAIGGGGRFSILNVNFNLAYGFNPQPNHTFGQGRGAVLFSLTYASLFR